jgi:uridine kinase
MDRKTQPHPEAAAVTASALLMKARDGGVIAAAIDGAGGAGKSTLAASLRKKIGAVSIIRADDFYRPLHGDERAARDPEYAYRNYLECERLRAQALAPLRAGSRARYQARDWTSGELRGWVEVEPNPIVLIEGVYSSRPELRDLLELAIFVATPRADRLARMTSRTPDDTKWIERWMAAEDWYLEHFRPADTADLVVNGF